MIIRLLSHTFFILTFITASAIFGYFGDLQYLEIRSFRNIRMLSLAFGKGIANLRKTKSYLRLIIGLSSGKALDKMMYVKKTTCGFCGFSGFAEFSKTAITAITAHSRSAIEAHREGT